MSLTKKVYSLLTAEEKVAKLCTWLQENKAVNTLAVDITAFSNVTDIVVITTANSVRHAQSLAENMLAFCKAENFEFLRLEGQAAGQWVLADLNDVVVHIFQKDVRELYNLEGLWPGAQLASGSISED